MGGPQAMPLLRKDIPEQIGKQPGDSVHVAVEVDDKPREITIPDDIKQALVGSDQLEYFKRLAFSHRREYTQWIVSAKKILVNCR